jgi:glycerol-3-phosphate acyltransferase PlsX
MMPVIVDAMGGDFAPSEIVQGAILAAQDGVDVLLVGRASELEPSIPAGLPLRVHNAADVVGMDEHPARAVRKKADSSVRVAAKLVKQHPGSAFISAGATGAAMAAALMELGRMQGVERPGIACVIPTLKGDTIVMDVGANVDCKPSHLVQFGQMGNAYAQHVLGIDRPRVALLNIGSEEGKGNELCQAVGPLLAASGLNFVGNLEPDHLYLGDADVVVTDGFAGNIFLKTSEGISKVFQRLIGETAAELGEKARALGPLIARLDRYKPENPANAGAPLLGIDGACIICHGSARAQVIRHAIALGAKFAKSGALEAIRATAQGRTEAGVPGTV